MDLRGAGHACAPTGTFLTMHLPMSWYVAARIDNVLNRDYQLAYSDSTPRRGAYLALGRQQ
ncbi:MAG: hypothetical protein WCA53_28340 [Caballeronia sp.]